MTKFDISFNSQEENLNGNISFESEDNTDLLNTLIDVLKHLNFPLVSSLTISQRMHYKSKKEG